MATFGPHSELPHKYVRSSRYASRAGALAAFRFRRCASTLHFWPSQPHIPVSAGRPETPAPPDPAAPPPPPAPPPPAPHRTAPPPAPPTTAATPHQPPAPQAPATSVE